jgi:hypothetical protein
VCSVSSLATSCDSPGLEPVRHLVKLFFQNLRNQSFSAKRQDPYRVHMNSLVHPKQKYQPPPQKQFKHTTGPQTIGTKRPRARSKKVTQVPQKLTRSVKIQERCRQYHLEFESLTYPNRYHGFHKRPHAHSRRNRRRTLLHPRQRSLRPQGHHHRARAKIPMPAHSYRRSSRRPRER